MGSSEQEQPFDGGVRIVGTGNGESHLAGVHEGEVEDTDSSPSNDSAIFDDASQDTNSTASTTRQGTASWIPPSSPPSPPLRYDPRVRASTPDTPTPLFLEHNAHRHGKAGKSKLANSHVAEEPDFSTHARHWTDSQCSTEEDSHSLSCPPSTSSWPSDTRPPSPVSVPLLRDSSVASDRTVSQAPYAHFGEQPPLLAHSSAVPPTSTVLGHHYQPSTSLKRRGRPSVSISAQAIPDITASSGPKPRARLSKVREQASNGRPKVRLPFQHSHKRSFSVQWQQYDRWHSKSRSRLRDLLILLMGMLALTVVMYQVCGSSRSTPGKKTQVQQHAAPLVHLRHLEQPHRNTVVMYRILGNDLPPRHSAGQTLRNLRFMLSQEDDFAFLASSASSYGLSFEKYYVLNRLTSSATVDAILALFDEFGVPLNRVLVIPFEWEEYRKRALRFDEGVANAANMWGIGSGVSDGIQVAPTEDAHSFMTVDVPDHGHHEKRQTTNKFRAMEYALHDKNLYAINNNGGRNFALQHGRTLPHARWILPFDGNCFFTPSAAVSLFQAMAESGEGEHAKQHVIVPMTRLLDNEAVLASNALPVPMESSFDPMRAVVQAPESPEEPQIGFRWDSEVLYEAEMRYGRRSKLELLWRLGAIPFSRNFHNKHLPWEVTDRKFMTASAYGSIVNANVTHHHAQHSASHSNFFQAAWVYRLFSGERNMEESTPDAAQLRKMNRMRGIVLYLEKLDEQLVRGQEGCDEPGTCGFSKHKLWTEDTHNLVALRRAAKEDKTGALRAAAEGEADDLLLDCQKKLKTFSMAEWDLLNAHDVAKVAFRLARAGYVSSNTTFSAVAAEVIHARFLQMDPKHKRAAAARQIDHARVVEHRTANGLYTEASGYAFPIMHTSAESLWSRFGSMDSAHMRFDPLAFEPSLLLDALRLLSPANQPALSFSKLLKPIVLRTLFSHHLSALLLSQAGAEMSQKPRTLTEGALYDTRVAALAAYLDDARLLSRVVQRHYLRYLDPETGRKHQFSESVKDDVGAALRTTEAMYQGLKHIGYPVEDSKYSEYH